MAISYKFSIISAIPDPRRGERVNVGIAVFDKSGVEPHIFSTRKISALASGKWGKIVDEYAEALKGLTVENGDGDVPLDVEKLR